MELNYTAQVLIDLAITLLAAFCLSRIAKRLRLPNVTGYILAGILIGPHCLKLIDAQTVEAMSFLTDAALAFIAFGVGKFFKWSRLKASGVRVVVVTVLEALAAAAAAGLSGRPFPFAAGAFCGAILLNVGLTAVFATLSGALVLTVERKWDRRLWKSLLVYWLFLLSWLPITIGSFFKQTTVWEEIRHTRNVLPEPVLARKW